MPLKRNNGYRRAHWPAANKARGDAIDQAGDARVELKRVDCLAKEGLANYNRGQHHLMAALLHDILRMTPLIDKQLEMVQTILENAPAGEGEDVTGELADIKRRLELLEKLTEEKQQ